jgi:hypothetical protein
MYVYMYVCMYVCMLVSTSSTTKSIVLVATCHVMINSLSGDYNSTGKGCSVMWLKFINHFDESFW